MITWIKNNIIIVAIVLIVLLIIVYKRNKKGIPVLSLRSSEPNAEEKGVVNKITAINNLSANKKTGDALIKQEEHVLKFYREATAEEKAMFNEFLDYMLIMFPKAATKSASDFNKFFTDEIVKFENTMYEKYGKDKMKAYREKLDKYAVDI